MTALDRLGQVSNAYAREVQAFEAVAVAAAEAEAAHKHARARMVLTKKASEERMSQAEAEARAEADDGVAELYRQRMVSAALADAARQRLNQLREQVAVGRSFATSEREADRLHATDGRA